MSFTRDIAAKRNTLNAMPLVVVCIYIHIYIDDSKAPAEICRCTHRDVKSFPSLRHTERSLFRSVSSTQHYIITTLNVLIALPLPATRRCRIFEMFYLCVQGLNGNGLGIKHHRYIFCHVIVL